MNEKQQQQLSAKKKEGKNQASTKVSVQKKTLTFVRRFVFFLYFAVVVLELALFSLACVALYFSF